MGCLRMVVNNGEPSGSIKYPSILDIIDRRIISVFSSPNTTPRALDQLNRDFAGYETTDTWRGAIRGLIDRGILRAASKADNGEITYVVDVSELRRIDPRESGTSIRLYTAELENSAGAVYRAHQMWKQAQAKPGAYVTVLDSYRTLSRAIDAHNNKVAALARRRAIEIAAIPTCKLF